MSLRNNLLLGCALLVASANPVMAQGIKDLRKVSPVELMPEPRDEPRVVAPVEMPTENLSEPPAQLAVEPAPAPVAEPAPVTVPAMGEVTVLPARNISLDTLGIYDEKAGGLAFDVWDGSSHARVRRLLDNLPQTVPSPTVRQLVARLLLSSTRPPASENIQQNVFVPRIKTLLHIDQVAQAQRLLERVPQNLRSEATAQLEYTTHLLQGDSEWVCSNIGTALQQYGGDSAFWQKLSIFCNAQAGDVPKVQLALDLLNEQQIEVDAGFVALIDTITGRSDKISTRFSAPLSIADAALIAISGQNSFPEGYLDTAPLPVLRLVKENAAFADYIKDDAEKRLSAAIALEKPLKPRLEAREWARDVFEQAPERRINFDRLTEDMQKRDQGSNEVQLRRRYRLYTLLQALGFGDIASARPWEQATLKHSGQVEVSPALRAELATAMDAEKTGEAILLLGMVAGQVNDFAKVDDATLADMVQALSQLGYEQEAQALAAEAMSALY